MLRTAGVLLLTLLFPPLLLAQPLQVLLEVPRWVDDSAGFDITVRVTGVAGPTQVSLSLKGGGLAFEKTLRVNLSGSDYVAVPVVRLQPGVYTAAVTVSAASASAASSTEVYVAPSRASLLRLVSRLSEVEGELSRVRPVVRNSTLLGEIDSERSRIYTGLSRLAALVAARENLKEAALLYGDLYRSIERVYGLASSAGGYELFVWSALVPLDSSLKFPADATYLWAKLAAAFLLLVLLLVALYPLYAADYRELVSLVSDRKPDGEVLDAVSAHASEILEAAGGEITSFEKPGGYLRLILATFLASIGLMTNNVTAIIGSMLLSSLMGVAVAGAASLATRTPGNSEALRYFYRGLRDTAVGIVVIVLSSLAISLAASLFVPLQPTPELEARGSPNLADAAVAMCAGAVASLSMIYRREVGPLVGAAIAIALVPPAAAVGVSLAMLNPRLFTGAASLLTINVLALMITGYLVAKIYILAPVFRHVWERHGGGRNPLLGSLALVEAWADAVLGVARGASLGDALAKIGRRIYSTALLPLASLGLAALATSTISNLLSSAHASVIAAVADSLTALLPTAMPRWAALLASTALAIAASAVVASQVREYRRRGSPGSLAWVAVSSFLLWLSLGYILGIHLLSSIAALFTVALATAIGVALYKPIRGREATLLAKLLVVLTLTLVLVNSASAFTQLEARRRLAGGFTLLAREVVASHLGVLPEDVELSVEGANAVRAVVRLDVNRLEELSRVSGLEAMIEEAIRALTGVDVHVSIDLTIKPP
ncbi:DUF389 domain-containing protein [Infirmifilum sp. SLHALR2]|nr:MAG: hypothetical protein B7L53_06535 [Thermofilum sp. NZ13]